MQSLISVSCSLKSDQDLGITLTYNSERFGLKTIYPFDLFEIHNKIWFHKQVTEECLQIGH